MFCLNNMWFKFLRWLRSIKQYWKQTDSMIEKNTASSRNANCHASSHRDYLLRKQSYKVRLGMFDIVIGILSFLFKLFQPLCVHSFGNPCSSFPVLYAERYNDLEKHVCSVNNHDISFDHFHPCAALTVDHVSDGSAMFVLSHIDGLYHTAKLPGRHSSELQNRCSVTDIEPEF